MRPAIMRVSFIKSLNSGLARVPLLKWDHLKVKNDLKMKSPKIPHPPMNLSLLDNNPREKSRLGNGRAQVS
jgi:hypothetical protein